VGKPRRRVAVYSTSKNRQVLLIRKYQRWIDVHSTSKNQLIPWGNLDVESTYIRRWWIDIPCG